MKGLRSALVLAAMTPAVACAQWSDNFDSYPVGVINGPGGWEGWDNVAAACGVISTAQARSAPNSISIEGTQDAVQQFTGVNSGQWILTTHLYLPPDWSGIGYFILMNSYTHGGPYDWTLQLEWATATGFFREIDVSVRPNNFLVPIVYDAWVEIRAEFDLDNDLLEVYYNNSLVTSGPWRRVATTSLLNFAAIDLWGNSSTIHYYDDFSLVQVGGGCEPDLTTGAIAGAPGYGVPNGVLNNDDFFYYLAQFAAGNLAVADLTTGAISGQPGYGVPNGILNNDDFFYYLAIFAAGC
ncbi:MAG: GC-type dockerin domain-anchored protein [Phycisphaerales bacterium]